MPRPSSREMVGFKLWVNLPASMKMTTPRCQNIVSTQIPAVNCENGVLIRVIAGEVDGIRGPVTDIFADPTYLDITVPANAAFTYCCVHDHTVFAYVFEGRGLFGAKSQKSIE